MTRREKLEGKLERREEWAEKARARSVARLTTADDLARRIPMGQPILVGHHSEKGHRAHVARIHGNMDKGLEEAALADHHVSKADGLERQLATNIFSDDDDAIERIREKIAKLEAERAWAKAVNAAWRKAKKPAADDATGWQAVAGILGVDLDRLQGTRRNMARNPWVQSPFPPYVGTNLSGNIGRYKKRILHIERMRERSRAAEDAGGINIEGTGDYVSITFAEKPKREILTALKVAGFYWSSGSWNGKRADIPEEVKP